MIAIHPGGIGVRMSWHYVVLGSAGGLAFGGGALAVMISQVHLLVFLFDFRCALSWPTVRLVAFMHCVYCTPVPSPQSFRIHCHELTCMQLAWSRQTLSPLLTFVTSPSTSVRLLISRVFSLASSCFQPRLLVKRIILFCFINSLNN